MRSIASAILTALSGETVRVIYLVKLVFDGGTIAWNTGHRDIVYGGTTFTGLGEMTSIAAAKEEPGVSASSISVGISGIKSEIISLLLSEPYINRPAYIYYTLLDDQDKVITGDPVLLFRGSMDSINGEQGASAGFTVEIKSRLADWERPRRNRYSDAEQQKLYPGDKGFEFVGQMEQARIIWPRAAFLPDQRD
jgi:hypothetical protein